MVPLLYIFPVIFFILAFIAFFVNVDEGKGKLIFFGLAFFLVILLTGNEIIVHHYVKEATDLEKKITEVNDWKQGQIARLNAILATMSNTLEIEKEKLASLATLGWTSSNPIIREAYKAEEARAELLEFIPPAQNPVIIEKLPGSVDKMILSFALEEAGFIVSAHQAQSELMENESSEANAPDVDASDQEQKNEEDTSEEEAPEVVENNADEEPNTLLYGHLVRNNDIKLILYTLLRAGIQIKHAKVYRNQSSNNARSVSFSYSKAYRRRPAYTVEQIKQTKRFKR